MFVLGEVVGQMWIDSLGCIDADGAYRLLMHLANAPQPELKIL